jgi:hypothetical protein
VARHRLTTAQVPAPIETGLGLLAALVWWVSEGLGWLRVLIATTTAVVVLGLAHTAVAPLRSAASTWGQTTVLAPALPVAALVVGHA